MRYLTAGESHGSELTAIIEGLPAGLSLTEEDINKELSKRQEGYGRGERMRIETDRVRFTSGLRHGKTLGSPLTMVIENKDNKNWKDVMSSDDVDEKTENLRKITKPRPGHADLVGGMKYDFSDLRNVLERSSARETAIRVAIGALSKKILVELDIKLANHVVNFGGIKVDFPRDVSVDEVIKLKDKSQLGIINPNFEEAIKKHIDNIKLSGDTIGGVIEVLAENVPAGLGSYVHWDSKLDGKIAQAVTSINAFKGVEFGRGFELASHRGSQIMDEINWEKEVGYGRMSNNLGGFEGGMTNGETLIIKAVMKPIPTLYKPLMSVDIESHKPYKAQVERSDPTAVPAAGVVMENVVATVLVQEILESLPATNMDELKSMMANYRKKLKDY